MTSQNLQMAWMVEGSYWKGFGEGRKVCLSFISLSLVSLTLNRFMVTMPEIRRSKAFLSSIIMFQTIFKKLIKVLFIYFLTSWHVELPWPGVEPMPPAVEAQSLNHWTTKEVPPFYFLLVVFQFQVLGLNLPFILSLFFLICCEIGVQLYSSAYGYPVGSTPFIEETIFSLLYVINSFVIDWLTVSMCLDFWALYSVPLI